MAAPMFEGGKIKTFEHLINIFRHDETEIRLLKQHRNIHLNKELTHLNYSLKNLTIEERLNRMIDVLSKCTNYDSKQTGEGHNDNVILHSVILYPPDEVCTDLDAAKKWFDEVGLPAMMTCTLMKFMTTWTRRRTNGKNQKSTPMC